MKALIQRVNCAQVTVDEKIIGQINKGLLIFLGIAEGDSEKEIDYLIEKIINLRIFENQDKKFDLSLKEINGEALIVSQFTLYGSCNRGRRPEFVSAAKPDKAKKLYEKFIEKFRQTGIVVATGEFGVYMKVNLENDGPATFVLSKEKVLEI
jgi:D-tyrosyl-tRNA(Tyr) deacylase